MSIIKSQQVVHINKFNTNQTLIGPHRYNVLSVPIPGSMILRDCEVALSELNLYNSIFNVTAALGNNQITIVYPVGVPSTAYAYGYNFTIPDGLYQIDDLNDWLQTTLIANGLYSTISSVVTTFIRFAYNPIYLHVQVTTSPRTGGTPGSPTTPSWVVGSGTLDSSNYLSGQVIGIYFGLITNTQFAVYFGLGTAMGTMTDLCTLLGASTTGVYPNIKSGAVPTVTTIVALPNIPQDTPYNTVLVACNLVASTLMPQYNNIIYDFAPATSAAGTQLTYAPYPDFFDCVDGNYNEIRVAFVDENEAPVPIEDPTMSVTLLIRPKPISDSPTETDLGNNKSLAQELTPLPNQDNVNLVTRLQPKRPRFGRS
jgi:hypothetical protein